jgi:hypothetical protein
MISGIASAKAKLARAAKHLRAVRRLVAIYSASRPHKIVAKAKGKKRLNIPRPPPREISLLIGEMVYQMRSALDHLAFDLVKRNQTGAALPPDWERECQFPIWTMPLKSGQTPPLPYNAFERTLPGISKQAFAFIESVQPYYDVGAVNNSLRFLAHLSNIDKHRHLNLVRPRTRKFESFRFASGWRGSGHEALDRGAQISPLTGWDDLDRLVYVSRRYRTFVAFNERSHLGDATTLPVDFLLKTILEQINLSIVPEFRKLIQNP